MGTSRSKMFCIICTASVLIYTGCDQKPESTKSPQEVSSAVFDSVITLIQNGEVSSRQDFEKARNSIASGLFGTIRADSSSSGRDATIRPRPYSRISRREAAMNPRRRFSR